MPRIELTDGLTYIKADDLNAAPEVVANAAPEGVETAPRGELADWWNNIGNPQGPVISVPSLNPETAPYPLSALIDAQDNLTSLGVDWDERWPWDPSFGVGPAGYVAGYSVICPQVDSGGVELVPNFQQYAGDTFIQNDNVPPEGRQTGPIEEWFQYTAALAADLTMDSIDIWAQWSTTFNQPPGNKQFLVCGLFIRFDGVKEFVPVLRQGEPFERFLGSDGLGSSFVPYGELRIGEGLTGFIDYYFRGYQGVAPVAFIHPNFMDWNTEGPIPNGHNWVDGVGTRWEIVGNGAVWTEASATLDTYPFCGACGWDVPGAGDLNSDYVCDACGMDLRFVWAEERIV